MRRRLNYANVMATIAVFAAIGGSAYAATQLPKNSVGAKQLKKNAVTTAKVKDGAITGQKIKLSTLGTVPSAATAGSAGTAANADALGGKPASAFAASTIVRSATVSAAGTLVAAKSDGIGPSNFLHTGEGIYCLKGLNPPPHTAVASVDLTAEQGSTVATGVEAEPECQVTIFTYDKAGVDANRPFSVIVH
ncbi:MAG: hypothetical protein ACTHN7_05405 [Solirubrobacterales bacterium]